MKINVRNKKLKEEERQKQENNPIEKERER
jgi:hypothetical protein